MKKTFKSYFHIWAICLLMFNVITFIVPSDKDGAFWVGYVFISIAFVIQLYYSNIAFQAENLQKLFYNIPLITISYNGLVIMLVSGILTMTVPKIPVWLGVVICVLVTGFTIIAVIKAGVAADIVSEIDTCISDKTAYIASLGVDAQNLTYRAGTPAIKAECEKIYEAIRYSDPMSKNELETVEKQITEKFLCFTDAVKTQDINTVKSFSNELLILLAERNNICKSLK